MKTSRVLPALACLAMVAYGQPASDLLQSAIFNQESLGNLDAAIRTYRQIIGAPDLKVYAAEAQYRLGTCLLRKGDAAGAKQAFESVILNYPNETELVARAREYLPAEKGQLLPAPWQEDEVSEYRWASQGGEHAWMMTRVRSGGSSRLRLFTLFYTPAIRITRVEVDPASMRPLRPGTQGALPPYDCGEILQLLRRMPLSFGTRQSFPVACPDGTGSGILQLSIDGPVAVDVPAGSFSCYRVKLALRNEAGTLRAGLPVETGDTLYYAVNGAHSLVKIERSGTTLGELVSVGSEERATARSYRDPKVGYSLAIPPGWYFHARPAINGPSDNADLFDPDFRIVILISSKSESTRREDIERVLRDRSDPVVSQRDATRTQYSVRPQSRRSWRLGDAMAYSWMADFRVGVIPHTEYITWVQTEHTRTSIVIRGAAADFEKLRQQWDSVLNSFREP